MKEELQAQTVREVREKNFIVLRWCTGLGKSKAAIDIQQASGSKSTLIVVAEKAHIKNWELEYIKHNKESLLSSTTIICYASLKNYLTSKYELVILDEGHHIATDLRLEHLKALKMSKLVILSATLPLSTISIIQMNTNLRDSFISTFSLQRAIQEEIIPRPRVYLIPMALDNTVRNNEVIDEWGKADLRVTIECTMVDRWKYMKSKSTYPHVRLVSKCTEKEKYQWLTSSIDYYKNAYMRSRLEYIKNKWLRLGSERKKFLGECKTPIIKEIIETITSKRFICFCTSINQAEELGGNNSIHSKRKDSLEVIDSFNSKKTNSLFAVGMLQEGQNLNDIEVGVIVQLDGQERAFIQKFGRSLRANSPTQIITYFKGTRDEEYLSKALENIDPECIQVIENPKEIVI